jgi:hypothetical protein
LLTTAGVHYRSEIYSGAAHGYTMADTPAYDETAAEGHSVPSRAEHASLPLPCQAMRLARQMARAAPSPFDLEILIGAGGDVADRAQL